MSLLHPKKNMPHATKRGVSCGYPEAEQIFTCNLCGRICCYCMGQDDDMPESCTDCWAKTQNRKNMSTKKKSTETFTFTRDEMYQFAPFRQGDWITVRTKSSQQYAPAGRTCWLAESTPEYVGPHKTSSGWSHRGVDSTHFRKADLLDLRQYRRDVHEQRRASELLEIEILEEISRQEIQRGIEGK